MITYSAPETYFGETKDRVAAFMQHISPKVPERDDGRREQLDIKAFASRVIGLYLVKKEEGTERKGERERKARVPRD